jgi:hypothetical protein
MKSSIRRLRYSAKNLLGGSGRFCADTCVFSEELKLVYAYVPKAGCTSIKTWLLRHGGFSPEIAKQFADAEAHGGKTPDAHQCMRSGFLLRQRSRAEIESVLSDPTVFKFCVVRHPLARLVSAYLSKVVRNNAVAHELIRRGQVSAGCLKPNTFFNWIKGLPLDPKRGLTFREFVHTLKSQDPRWLDSHFRSQDRLLRGIEFNVVVRLENIQEDFAAVHQYLDIDTPLPTHNASRYMCESPENCVADAPAADFRKGQAPHWDQFYDEILRAECEALYTTDFVRFGYTMTNSHSQNDLAARNCCH